MIHVIIDLLDRIITILEAMQPSEGNEEVTDPLDQDENEET